MTYNRILAALLAAAALAGCSSLRTDSGGAGSTSYGTKNCSYAGAAAECRGLHNG
ncbi:MAG TPA: lipoprotein [Burkholderiales bacterium]|jgi:uncharacterized protein YceK|nr:lipoprotein [Burkholderiales bacterium]